MGLLSKIGGIVNDVMGATSANKTAYKQQIALNNMSYNQQKEFAQNAHQWEAQDLANAGYNPALTAGGTSASSIAGGGKTGGNANAITNGNILGIIGNILEYKNQNEVNSANIKETEARTQLTQLQAIKQAFKNQNLPKEFEARLREIYSNITKNMATSAKEYSQASLNKQTLELNAPVITDKDVDDLTKKLEDENISTGAKLWESVKTLGKAFLLSKARGS